MQAAATAALDAERNEQHIVRVIKQCYEKDVQLCFEKFDYAVHREHLIEERTDESVHLGLSKQLYKALALAAHSSQE